MSDQEYSSVDWDDGLALTRRQAIIWTNDDLVCWRIYTSLDELNEVSPTHLKIIASVINPQ